MYDFIPYEDKYEKDIKGKVYSEENFKKFLNKKFPVSILSLFGLHTNQLYLLVEKESRKFLGSLVLTNRVSYRSPRKFWWIYSLLVLEEHRGKNLPNIMLRKSIEIIKEKNGKAVLHYADKNNKFLIEYYKRRLGYKIIENSKIHRIFEDRHLMVKHF